MQDYINLMRFLLRIWMERLSRTVTELKCNRMPIVVFIKNINLPPHHMCLYDCMWESMWVCLCDREYVCLRVWVCMYEREHVSVCACAWVREWVYVRENMWVCVCVWEIRERASILCVVPWYACGHERTTLWSQSSRPHFLGLEDSFI